MEMSAVRLSVPVFFAHGNQSTLLDMPSKKPWCELTWNPGDLVVRARDRRSGEVVLIPLSHVAGMAPKDQAEADMGAPKVEATPREVIVQKVEFVDTRLEESRAIAKKGRKAG